MGILYNVNQMCDVNKFSHPSHTQEVTSDRIQLLISWGYKIKKQNSKNGSNL